MNKKVVFQGTALAAVLALIGIALQLIAVTSVPGDVNIQPYGVDINEFLRATEEYADAALLFFAGDTLFPLSYLLVFVGLYAVTEERARLLALIGLGAGILATLFDVSENAYFISYALLAKNGGLVTDPALLTIYVITTLKWTMAFGTLYAFALAFPRRTRFDQVLTLLMLAFPVFGIAGVANPALIAGRGLFFLVGMPLFAWYFWMQARAQNTI